MLSGGGWSFQLIALSAAIGVAAVTAEQNDSDQRRSLLPSHVEENGDAAPPSDFYCVLVMKIQQELECYFIAWPGTTWNLSYITNAISGSVNIACDRHNCGVNIPGSAQHFTTYNFTLRNLSAPAREPHSITHHAVYSDDYITRLDRPEDLVIESGRRQVLVKWSAPLSSYGVLGFVLEDAATRYGLEHEVSYYISSPRPRLIKAKMLTSSQLEEISLVLADLEPFSTYAVQIRSRINGSVMEQSWSRPATTVFRTLEEAPAVAPEVVRDGFNLHACNASHCTVKIYWKGIPETSGKSNGIIVGYLVRSTSHGQEVLVSGSRRLVELLLDMKHASEFVVLGITSAGRGPTSIAVRIPSLAEVLYLDTCSLNVKELNETTVHVSWSVSTDLDIIAVRLHWCLIVYSECWAIRTSDGVFGSNGSDIITTDGSTNRYRFGLSAAAKGFASGIVWHYCPDQPIGDAMTTLRGNLDSGLPHWAVAAIVVAITLVVCAVSLFLWRFIRDGKSIKSIDHIPKTHSTSRVNVAAFKYEAVVLEEPEPSLVHANCSEKGGNSLIPMPKRHDEDYVQHSDMLLDLSQHAIRQEASLGHEQPLAWPAQQYLKPALLPSDCSVALIASSMLSKNSADYGYPVSFRDLIDQARAERYNLRTSLDAAAFGLLALPDSTVDGSGSIALANWCDSVADDGKVQTEAESKTFDGTVKPTNGFNVGTHSHPSSDYVMVASVEQQN